MAKVFLDPNDSFTVSNNNTTVFGTSGVEVVTIASGVTGTVLDQNTERVALSGASSAYTYQQQGNQLVVYSGTTVVSTTPLQSGANGTQFTFSNGTVNVKVSAAGMTFGGTTVVAGTTAAAATSVTPATIDNTVISGPPVAATPTFTVSGATAASEGANASFTVAMTGRATGVAYTVTLALAATGGATAGTDFTNALTLDAASVTAGYTYTAGVLTVPSTITGTTASAVFTTAITADAISPETGEGLSVTLSAPTGASAVIGTAASVTTAITDVPVTYKLTASSDNVYEGATNTYTITTSAPVAVDTIVNFSVTPGDATAADQGTGNTNLNDFAAGAFNPAPVTIKAGQSTATYSVAASTDTKTELPETFAVKAVVGTTTVGTISTTLLDGSGPNVGQTYTLTTGIDTFVGGGNNDTFTASAATNTLTSLDNLDGGLGTDTLSVSSVAAITTTGTTVVNIESATLNSGADVNANTSAWTGLTSLTVSSAATANESFTAASTTAVKITNTTAFDTTLIGGGGAVTITNDVGGNINVGQTAVANAITSATTSGGLAVAIQDRSGASAATGSTLTTVSVSGNAGAATLTGNGITSVTLGNSSQNATIVAAAATRTLGLTFNKTTAGTVTDATATTVNVTSTGTASVVADLAVAAATAVTLGGDKALTLTTTHFDVATGLTVNGSALTTVSGYNTTNKLTGVTVTGAGGLTTNLSGQGTQLTTIDASGSSGPNSVTINGTQIYKGGSGVDIVTAAVAPTVSVDGGAGTADVFVVNAASFSLSKVTGFEILGAGAGATGAYSAAGFTGITEGAVAGAVTWNTVAAGTTLTMTAAPTAATIYTLATDTASDVLNLTLTSAGAIAGGSLTATLVETVNIAVTDTDTTKHVDTLTLVDTALTTLKITGNAGLTLTNTNTTVTSADASAVTNTAGTSGGFTWTTGALAGASVIKGTSTGGDTINAAAAVAAVTITETAGTNAITGSSTIASTLTGGTGIDTIVGGAGKDTIVGGGGADLITAGAGADKITVSGTTSTITQAVGASGTNTSTAIQTAELTSTFDVIYGAAAGLKIDTGNTNVITGTLTLTATNLAVPGYTSTGVGTESAAGFARGTYDATNGVFTYGAAGLDTAVTYDSTTATNTQTWETIILVGYVSGTGTTAGAGVITLA